MQIKTTVRYHLITVKMAYVQTQVITNTGKNVEKMEPSYTAGRKVNYYDHYGKQFGGSSKAKISAKI